MLVKHRSIKVLAITFLLIVFCIFVKTYHDLKPVDCLFTEVSKNVDSIRIADRHGKPLMMSYQSRWNQHDQLPLHQFPDFLINALIFSEDRNFYDHGGIDWSAKAMALWQNIKAFHVVRGASTITEQVAHMITQRPRTVWSKWLGILESYKLEKEFTKNHLLEFYLNQVPFAANRRGFVQGARYYFNRDLSTLTKKEILALLILIRSPSKFDLKKSKKWVEGKINQLGKIMVTAGQMTSQDLESFKNQPLMLEDSELPVQAFHFISYLKEAHQESLRRYPYQLIRVTLDGSLQKHIQQLLDQRLNSLLPRQVRNGAVLVVDAQKGDVLAWVVGTPSILQEGKSPRFSHSDFPAAIPGAFINGVVTLRQPGSVLKPFIYAMALEKGWSASTQIEDEPLVGAVGNGLHQFHNYSHVHYGSVSLREALANSLNVPAIKAIRYVGVDHFLEKLHELGFASLGKGAQVYHEGLALGNGEVTLLELVSAYTVLANRGKQRPLRYFVEGHDIPRFSPREVFLESTTRVISDILSDPWARHLEFGASSIMNMPFQTAIKTGTSTDYRDAWIVGYNNRYVVGIWMGNYDNKPTLEVTGSIGPALLLRSIFNHLNRFGDGEAFRTIDSRDQRESESFLERQADDLEEVANLVEPVRFIKPTSGLRMAIDPRIPREKQKFEFQLSSPKVKEVEWILNDVSLGRTQTPTFLWALEKGDHKLKAILYESDRAKVHVPEVRFLVK